MCMVCDIEDVKWMMCEVDGLLGGCCVILMMPDADDV